LAARLGCSYVLQFNKSLEPVSHLRIRSNSRTPHLIPALLTLALLPLQFGCSSAQATPGLSDPATTTVEKAASSGPVMQVAPQATLPTQSSVADLVDHVSSTVVNITTVQRRGNGGPSPFDFFQGPRGTPHQRPPRTGAGTGFIIDPGGYVVTNAHVVHAALEVKVRLRDDREFSAEVVGRDRKLDLALLHIKGASKLPAVVLGNSSGLRVGEHVVAVGNPFGLGHTVTMGIVSAKARTIGAGPYDAFIQTDASINPGNSGGPLFNLRGEVVGINTAIRAGADGIGFAIPVESLKDVVPQLRDKGFVERGKLGLAFQPLTPDLARALGRDRPHGAMVTEVEAGSAADRAGLRSGDLIIGIDRVPIKRADQLPRHVARHAPGSTIEVHVLRNGNKLKLRAQLDKLEGDQPDDAPESPRRKAPKTKKMLGLEIAAGRRGVKVVRVDRPGSGLRPGDVIVEVNGRNVGSVQQFRDAVAGTKRRTALLKVRRGNGHRFVGVPLDN
jgi:serine protease Do